MIAIVATHAGALAMIALGIAIASVDSLLDPGSVAYTEALWIAVIGLAVNLASAWLLGGGDLRPLSLTCGVALARLYVWAVQSIPICVKLRRADRVDQCLVGRDHSIEHQHRHAVHQ